MSAPSAADVGHSPVRVSLDAVASQRKPLPKLPVLGWKSIGARRQIAPLLEASSDRAVVYASSGRAAIFLAFDLLGIGAGDQVLVPTYHCPTMVAPIVRAGATPVFYPVDESACADLDWLASARLARPKALLAAHFFGLPRPMAALKQFCAARGIALIEDCAHASFGGDHSAPIGGFGDLTITSLPKFFPVMDGGCLIGPAELLSRAQLAPPGILEEVRAIVNAMEIGAGYGRFGAFGAALGFLTRLRKSLRRTHDATQPNAIEFESGAVETWLDERLLRRRSTAVTRWTVQHAVQDMLIERRRSNYRLWSEEVQGLRNTRPLIPDLPSGAVPYVFPLVVEDPEAKYKELRAQGVPIFRWDVAWPNIPVLPKDHGRRWLTQVFQLGCHQDLDADDIRYLASVVRRVSGKA
jgi:perosamine synthetase